MDWNTRLLQLVGRGEELFLLLKEEELKRLLDEKGVASQEQRKCMVEYRKRKLRGGNSISSCLRAGGQIVLSMLRSIL